MRSRTDKLLLHDCSITVMPGEACLLLGAELGLGLGFGHAFCQVRGRFQGLLVSTTPHGGLLIYAKPAFPFFFFLLLRAEVRGWARVTRRRGLLQQVRIRACILSGAGLGQGQVWAMADVRCGCDGVSEAQG